MSSNECFIPSCKGKGVIKKFKFIGIKLLILRSKIKADDLHLKLEELLEASGEDAFVNCHKSCYCSYTSKRNNSWNLAKKRKHCSDGKSDIRICRSNVPNFQFKLHCLMCGEVCLPKDPKNPGKWKMVRKCETHERPGASSFKKSLLDICDQRGDEWGRQVEIRIKGALTDLPAADAQYHKQCYDKFAYIPKNTNLSEQSKKTDDEALNLVIDDMYKNQNICSWTSCELFKMYCDFEGLLTAKQMFNKLTKHLGEDIVVISMDGCANIVGFRKFIGKSLKLVKVNSVDDDHVDAVVRKIKKEAKDLQYNNSAYDLNDFTYNKVIENTSATLLRIIAELVANGEINQRSLSLTQAVQSHISKTRNQTTLGLAIKLHHMYGSSELIKILYDHGFTAAYDEVLRFRKSASKFVGDNTNRLHVAMGLHRGVGPIFGWFDNFDLLVSTPNGRRETHVMAHEFQMTPESNLENSSTMHGVMNLVIPRLLKSVAQSLQHTPSVTLQHYQGRKKVNPPAITLTSGVSYSDICSRQRSLESAQHKDIEWLNALFSVLKDVDWHGFNTRLAREQNQSPKPATVYLLGHLIDNPPSHPDTVFTSMLYMTESLTEQGMTYVNLSVDMQLYMVAQQIKWSDQERFDKVILRPGAMHIIMSFLGCIGYLMRGSGLDVLVSAAFGHVTAIMNGKSWVMSMRAFRMVTAALLKSFLKDGPKTFDELEADLEVYIKHPTGNHWVNNFIKPTILVHQFLRAEREGDWLFQQYCLGLMEPYFFCAGHFHYARHISWHLIEMRVLPSEVKADLVSGAHVCRHNKGYWNSVSSDQFGEQTAIKTGKGGLKGMTLSAELVTEWINAFPIMAYMSDSMVSLYSEEETENIKSPKHKEEGSKRQKLDYDDIQKIVSELAKHSHPLIVESPKLYNIVNGQISPDEVNVVEAVSIGEKMATSFKNSLPNGFHTKISTPVKTMEKLKQGIKVGDKSVFDLAAIFFHMLMIGEQLKIEKKYIFQFELCVVPSSIIDEYGCLRKGNKAVLMNRLSEKITKIPYPDVVIVDAQQLLYHIVWPNGGMISAIVDSMKQHISYYPNHSKKIIVFDKYDDCSVKDHERVRRAGEGSVSYNLTHNSPLPHRDAIMKNKQNKVELTRLISSFDMGENVSTESRADATFDHDEADITLISYLLQDAEPGKVIRIVSDDTDVFVLLVYWIWKANLVNKCRVQMERWDGNVLDINKTCIVLGSKCLQLLGMHAISGCDIVSYPYSKGKISALNILKAQDFPELSDVLGEEHATDEDLLNLGQKFFAAMYGQPPGTTMNDARYNLYTKKKGKLIRIMTLPPTDRNLLEHMKRAHLAMILWKAANKKGPPNVEITKHGWTLKNGIPMPSFAVDSPAPPELLNVLSCACKAERKACSSANCTCRKNQLPCTAYCKCEGLDGCLNHFTIKDNNISVDLCEVSTSDEESDDID